MLILVIKAIHVLSAVVFFGSGIASAFYKVQTARSDDINVVAWYLREIVLADFCFTIPSGALLPVTGSIMVLYYGDSFTTPWILIGLCSWTIASTVWVLTAWSQLKLRNLAEEALAMHQPLPAWFKRANRNRLVMSLPAFLASGVAVWAMVTRWEAF